MNISVPVFVAHCPKGEDNSNKSILLYVYPIEVYKISIDLKETKLSKVNLSIIIIR